jgi:hypothetical protein
MRAPAAAGVPAATELPNVTGPLTLTDAAEILRAVVPGTSGVGRLAALTTASLPTIGVSGETFDAVVDALERWAGIPLAAQARTCRTLLELTRLVNVQVTSGI